jgi:hypothetical protein
MADDVMPDVVEGFIASLNAHDYDALRAFLADRFVRVGAQADVVVYTAGGYIEWVKEVLRDVTIYGKVVHQIVYSPDRRSCFVEMTEFAALPGEGRRESSAIYLFGLEEDGRINRMALYQMPAVPEEPPLAGTT